MLLFSSPSRHFRRLKQRIHLADPQSTAFLSTHRTRRPLSFFLMQICGRRLRPPPLPRSNFGLSLMQFFYRRRLCRRRRRRMS